MPLHCQHAKTTIRLLFLHFYRQLPGNNVLTTKSALTSKIMMSVSRLELQHVAAAINLSVRSRIPWDSVSHYEVTVDARMDLFDIVNTAFSWSYNIWPVAA